MQDLAKHLAISGLACISLVLALVASVATAATFVVTKESDDDGPCDVDDCALREAILAANTDPGIDTVVLPSGIYQLSISGPVEDASSTGDLDILDDLELLGDVADPPVIVGDGEDRVLEIGRSEVLISDVVVTGGGGVAAGGGIRVTLSEATIVDSLITGNSSDLDGGECSSLPVSSFWSIRR